MTVFNWWEAALCRTVGCCSIFARFSTWPHRRVCHRLTLWRVKRDGHSWDRDNDSTKGEAA